MFDFSKLRGRIREKGYTQHDIASFLKISDNALSNKLHGKSFFTIKETADICEFLEIESDDIGKYFFCSNGLES